MEQIAFRKMKVTLSQYSSFPGCRQQLNSGTSILSVSMVAWTLWKYGVHSTVMSQWYHGKEAAARALDFFRKPTLPRQTVSMDLKYKCSADELWSIVRDDHLQNTMSGKDILREWRPVQHLLTRQMQHGFFQIIGLHLQCFAVSMGTEHGCVCKQTHFMYTFFFTTKTSFSTLPSLKMLVIADFSHFFSHTMIVGPDPSGTLVLRPCRSSCVFWSSFANMLLNYPVVGPLSKCWQFPSIQTSII